MDLTSSNLNAMFTGFNVMFQEGFRNVAPWWTKLAMRVDSNTELETYAWIGDIPRMKEWVGPRIVHNLSTRDATIRNKDWEDTIKVPRNKILDDKYGIYKPMAQMLGYAAAKLADDAILSFIQSNPVGYDGVAFFSNAHPTNIDLGAGGGVQSNDFSLALTANNYATVRQSMMAYAGDQGRILGINPGLLVVPPQLEYTARTILNAELIAAPTIGNLASNVGSTTNVLRGSAELLVIPELANEATRWYFFDVSRPLKAFIWQVRQEPNFVYLTNPNDYNVFWNKEFVMGAEARGAAGSALWFLAARSTP